MRKVRLPINNSFIDLYNIKGLKIRNGVFMDDEIIGFPAGQLGSQIQKKQLEQARENGGQVIWGVSSVEKRLENFVSSYLFCIKIDESKEKIFFKQEIMESSAATYKFKKNLVLSIILKEKFLSGKDIPCIQKNLKSIMDYRNSFAHGELMIDNKNDVFLTYYSGDKKNDILNDDYWEKLESVFKETNELLNKAEKVLIERKKSELENDDSMKLNPKNQKEHSEMLENMRKILLEIQELEEIPPEAIPNVGYPHNLEVVHQWTYKENPTKILKEINRQYPGMLKKLKSETTTLTNEQKIEIAELLVEMYLMLKN